MDLFAKLVGTIIGSIIGLIIWVIRKVLVYGTHAAIHSAKTYAEKRKQEAPAREAARKARDEQRERDRLADAQRRAKEAQNRPMTVAELDKAIMDNVKAQKPKHDAEAYAKLHTPFFIRQYDMYYKSGQHNKIPSVILGTYKVGLQEQAVYNMLYNHKLNTGQNHPSP